MSKTSPSHRLPLRPWSLSPRAQDTQTQVHILSFEGPDPYARAGGIASRIVGLAQALADNGFETHLWFVGDPDLPGNEMRQQLWLHRWCQWISRHHPAGVYDGARRAGRTTARQYTWLQIMQRHLLPRLRLLSTCSTPSTVAG